MSILNELNAPSQSGIFGVIAGDRLSGKSTLAGTLPGKTFFLQAARLETGSSSAQKLAAEMGNDLTIRSFQSVSQLSEVLTALCDTDYDNVYIDGITAITELRFNEDEVQKMVKKDNWAAFRVIGKTMFDLILQCKDITEKTGKNIFLTLALKPKVDSLGNVIEVEPEIKGNATIGHIKGLCPVIVVPKETYNEQGQVTRALLTHSDGVWPARVDTLLDGENPGVLPIRDADGTSYMALANLINLVKGE